MKILVTGGAGYIGSHVVNLLGERNQDEIVVLDDLSTGREAAVLSGTLVKGNLGDSEFLDDLFSKNQFEAVIHFAGSIIVPESVVEPIKYYKNNTENSLRLIEMCKKHKVNNFIFSSTAAVYGTPESGICSETTPTGPINPYGHSKLMTEQLLEDFSSATKDFNYIALRYFNVAGANPNGKLGQSAPKSTHLIKLACETALGIHQKMKIFGDDYETEDGTCIRDFIHVDDLAQAHLDCLNYLTEKKRSNVFNCGYGKGYSVKEVISTLKKTCNVDFDVEIAPRRDGDGTILIANSDKLKSEVGWSPKFENLEYIVKTAFEWEKNYRNL